MISRCRAAGVVCLAFASIMGRAMGQQMPACAQPCIKLSTGCQAGDVACECTTEHLVAMQNMNFSSCVVDGCGTDFTLTDVVPAILALCDTVSSTIGGASTLANTGTLSVATAVVSNDVQTSTTGPKIGNTAGTTTSAPAITRGSTTASSVQDPASAHTIYGGLSDEKSGLKPGAIAGIAIGCLALLLGVLLAIFLMIRRRKRRSGGTTGTGNGKDGPHGAELDSRQIEELDGRNIEKVELADTPTVISTRASPPLSPPVELDGVGTVSSPSELSGTEGTVRSELDVGAKNAIPRKQIPLSPVVPVEVISAEGHESPEELARLAQEERRLDAEIAEAERIRDLRNQRAYVQERIAKAKGGS